MARTKTRQDKAVFNSDAYVDTQPSGAAMEPAPSASNLEFDENNIRSQLKRWMHGDDPGSWKDDVVTVNSKKRGIAKLNLDLDALEVTPLLFRPANLVDITVPSTQNFVVLSAAGAETPAQVAAVGVSNAEGALVALLAGDVGAHSLVEVAGPDGISPNNLVVVFDASTSAVITSGGKAVLALIQAESGVVDGDAFNDADKQVQLSFVRIDATGADLEAVPFGDIQSKSINYCYVRQVKLDSVPKHAFLDNALKAPAGTGAGADLDKILLTIAGTLVFIGDGDILERA